MGTGPLSGSLRECKATSKCSLSGVASIIDGLRGILSVPFCHASRQIELLWMLDTRIIVGCGGEVDFGFWRGFSCNAGVVE